MITRVTKKVADQHIVTHQHDNKVHPIKVLVIGFGRFYLSDEPSNSQETLKFIDEWQQSNGAELPSYPLITDNQIV